MITVKRLKEFLDKLPDDSTISAYDGCDQGILIDTPDGERRFIRASDADEQDSQPDWE